MRLLIPPGVFRPRSDSWLLADAARTRYALGGRVADVYTGTDDARGHLAPGGALLVIHSSVYGWT